MFRRLGWVLFAPAGDNDGGNGQDPAGQGQSGDGGAASASPELIKLVNDTVSKAIGPRLKEFRDAQTKALNAALAPLSATLATLTEKLDAIGTGGNGDDASKGKDAGAHVDLSQHPEFKAMKRDLENERKAREKRDSELAAERAKNRAAALLASVEEALIAEGYDAKGARRAAKQLIKADEIVAYESDDSDTIVFREADGVTTLSSGIKSWAQSDDGKVYLPARNPAGSGETPRGTGKPPNGAPPKNAIPSKADIGRGLLKNIVPGQQT